MFVKRDNIKSKFGTYTIAADTTNIKFDNEIMTKNQMYDFVLRQDGLQKKILQSQNLSTGLTNPDTYFQSKQGDLKRIIDELFDLFEKVYQEELKRGLPHNKTKQNVIEEVNRVLDRELKLHYEQFPEEVTNRILKKICK
jgi:cell division protein YceG involved in septum cleavage